MTPRKRSLAEEQRIRFLWEETPQTGGQIAVEFGVTKNVIAGLAYRRGWLSHPPNPKPLVMTREAIIKRRWARRQRLLRAVASRPYRTMDQRLDAEWAKMDRVLAETAPASGHYLGCPAEGRSNGEKGWGA